MSEISKYIPPSTTTRYNSAQRYYSPHSYGVDNQASTIKSADSVASLQPNAAAHQYASPLSTTTVAAPQQNTELLRFIEKQEGYIEQLERESKFCRVCSINKKKYLFMAKKSLNILFDPE